MAEIDFSIVTEGVGVLVINRPEKRNAVTSAMRQSLYEALRAPATQKLAAIVIRAEGDTFCAGADLKEVSDPNRADMAAIGDLWGQFRRTAPVIICAVQGLALGLGAGIAVSSDLVVAAEDAQFGYPEITHGLVPSYTAIGLQAILGQRHAFEMLLTGRRLPAHEAAAVGLVNAVVPNADLTDAALQLAAGIASNPIFSVHTAKRFFYEASEMPFSLGLRASERVVALVRGRREVQDKAAAFLAHKTEAAS